MAKAALQCIRTYAFQHALGQAGALMRTGNRKGVTCREHRAVMSLPASGTGQHPDTAGASLPPALPLAGGPWVAHLTSLSFSPSLPTKTLGLPSALPSHLRLTKRLCHPATVRPRWMILAMTRFTIVFYNSQGAWCPHVLDGETESLQSLLKTTRLRIRDRPRCG